MSFIRSFMLVIPSPGPLIAFCRSKPAPVSCSFEQHFELPSPTVLGRILKGFLQDTEQTECSFLRQIFRNVLGVKIDLDILLPRKLFAKALARRREP